MSRYLSPATTTILWLQSKLTGDGEQEAEGHLPEVIPQSERRKGREMGEQVTRKVSLAVTTTSGPFQRGLVLSAFVPLRPHHP